MRFGYSDRVLATKISKAMADAFRLEDRGIKFSTELGWINKIRTGLLPEICFIELFRKAGLYFEHEIRGGKIPIYPKIHDIKTDDKGTTFVFTIPNGLDPDKVEKKCIVFSKFLVKT